MAVTEALMTLLLKEMFSKDRVLSVTKRMEKVSSDLPEPENGPVDQEEALMMWLAKSCILLKKKAEQEQPVGTIFFSYVTLGPFRNVMFFAKLDSGNISVRSRGY